MASLRYPKDSGILIVEAVVAAFLMVFAFAAASSLFHASLQWESQGSNVRRAALVAEKKIGELRAWSRATHSGSSFDTGWSTQTGIRPEYPEAPGFQIEVLADQPTYGINPTTTERAPAGMYSPTSHFWDVLPTILGNPADFDNPQKDPVYQTFSRVRTFDKSFRRVQVIVRYGAGFLKEFRCVTLIGDPIVSINPVITFQRIAGSSSLGPGQAADYEVRLLDGSGGHRIEDIVCLWSADPKGTGALIVKPLDANGRTARVFRHPDATAGATRLAARVRYRGQEVKGFSDAINVL